MSVPKTRMDFCGNLLEEATEDSMVDHMSSFWDFDELVDIEEPGRSSKPPERAMYFVLLVWDSFQWYGVIYGPGRWGLIVGRERDWRDGFDRKWGEKVEPESFDLG